MRVPAGRGKGEGKEFRKFWKSSGEGISGGRASRKGRINRRKIGTRGGGESLTSEEYVTYFIDINPKSRSPNGGRGWARKKDY